jgi:hypothetical protein
MQDLFLITHGRPYYYFAIFDISELFEYVLKIDKRGRTSIINLEYGSTHIDSARSLL